MLDRSVAEPNSHRLHPRRFYSDGERVYAANTEDGTAYHGYPVPGREVPPMALRLLRDNGAITDKQYRALQGQSIVPGTE